MSRAARLVALVAAIGVVLFVVRGFLLSVVTDVYAATDWSVFSTRQQTALALLVVAAVIAIAYAIYRAVCDV